MADIEKGQPVRTEDDLQQKVQVKWVDHTDPNGVEKQAEVSEKKGHVRVFAKDSDAADKQVLLSQEGHVQSNGDYDASTNKRPSSQGLIASDRAAAPDETTMNKRPTAVAGEDDTVSLDVALRHSDGDRIDNNNPLPVYIEENFGDEICDYAETVVAADTTDQSTTYVVPDGKDFILHQVAIASSGRCKVLVEVGDGAVSEVFATKRALFISESSQDNQGQFSIPLKVVGTVNGTTVRLTKENRDDDDAQSIYSSIIGILKDS
jgi:hypothetical protein